MKREKRFIISLIPVLVLAFLFQSCLTADEASIAPPEPSEAMAGNIEQLAANDPEASIAMLSDLFEKQREKGEPLENSIIGGKAVELFGKSASTMLGLFRKALQEGDIVTAKRLSFSAHTISRYASLYESLKNVLPADFSAMGEPAVRLQLIFLEAEAKFKKNGYVAGKAVLAAALSAEPSLLSIRDVPSAISKEIDSAQEPALFFLSWAERAKANNDIEAAAWFGAMAGQIKFEAVSPQGEKEDWIASAVSGVVTVYVDRGFKIQGGYSVPDRVLGTGFQIAPGLYLTNHHVVQSEVDPSYKGYSRLSIRPSDNPQARVPAKVIGWDEEMDLALLQSEEKLQSVIYIPSSMKFQAGDRVFAVGSPIGLENSVTAGVVSSLSRKIISYGEAAQIDVPVNQGNSGSPLFFGQWPAGRNGFCWFAFVPEHKFRIAGTMDCIFTSCAVQRHIGCASKTGNSAWQGERAESGCAFRSRQGFQSVSSRRCAERDQWSASQRYCIHPAAACSGASGCSLHGRGSA